MSFFYSFRRSLGGGLGRSLSCRVRGGGGFGG
jgi:hypothetical protein